MQNTIDTPETLTNRIDRWLGRAIAIANAVFWCGFGLMFLIFPILDDRLPLWAMALGVLSLLLARWAWRERRSFSEMGKHALISG